MAEQFPVDRVAVENKVWSGQAEMVVARTTEGEIGILPHHIPLVAELVEGEMVRIDPVDGEEIHAAVHGGFLSVTEQGRPAQKLSLADRQDADRPASRNVHVEPHVSRLNEENTANHNAGWLSSFRKLERLTPNLRNMRKSNV